MIAAIAACESAKIRGTTVEGEQRLRHPCRMSGALPDATPDPTGHSATLTTERSPYDLRTRAIETVVLVASVIVLRMLGMALLVVSTFQIGSPDSILTFILLIADPNLVAWIALTAAVQFGLQSMRRLGRWALIVLAAPVSVILASMLRNLAGVLGAGIYGVLGGGIAWLDTGIMAVVVALSMAFTAAVLGRGRRRFASIAGGLVAVGGVLTLVLLWQAFETYFTLSGDRVVPTPEQQNRYVITAALTLACLVGAIVLAAVSRRRGLIITAGIVGCLGLVVALAVPVPLDRFVPRPSGETPVVDEPGGGGSCYGPGDPNCIGG